MVREYSTDDQFIENTEDRRDRRVGLLLLSALATGVATLLLFGGGIPWVLVVATGVLTIMLVVSLIARHRMNSTLHAVAELGYIVKVGDDGIDIGGFLSPWASLERLHLHDGRNPDHRDMVEAGIVAGDVASIHICTPEYSQTVGLEEFCSQDTIDRLLTDIRVTAKAHGIEPTESRSLDEYRDWSRAVNRKRRHADAPQA